MSSGQEQKLELIIDQIVDIADANEINTDVYNEKRDDLHLTLRPVLSRAPSAYEEIRNIVEDRENNEEGINLLTRSIRDFNRRAHVLQRLHVAITASYRFLTGNYSVHVGVFREILDKLSSLDKKLYDLLFTKVLPLYSLDDMLSIIEQQFECRDYFSSDKYRDVSVILVCEKMEQLGRESRDTYAAKLWKVMKSHHYNDESAADTYIRNGCGEYIEDGEFIFEHKLLGKRYSNHVTISPHKSILFYYFVYSEEKGGELYRVDPKDISQVMNMLAHFLYGVVQQDTIHLKRFGMKVGIDAARFAMWMIAMIDRSFVAMTRDIVRNSEVIKDIIDLRAGMGESIQLMDSLVQGISEGLTTESLNQLLIPYLERWRSMVLSTRV